MRHTVGWRQTDIVTAPDELSFGNTDGIALHNLFRQSLRPLFKSRGGKGGGSCWYNAPARAMVLVSSDGESGDVEKVRKRV